MIRIEFACRPGPRLLRPATHLFLILCLVIAGGAQAQPRIAVDVATGQVIEHDQAFQRWYPASITKLMTAYVAFRALRAGKITLDTQIVMTPEAAAEPASKMYFKPGTRFPLDSALKYLLVSSANDVAVAMGQAISGSEKAFVARMNREAQRLGMRDTRFVNPNGLPGEGQYSTARDLAVLAVALRREFPEFASYFALEGYSLGDRTAENYNMLIGRFNGADGMKTGYICASGFNQVSSATLNGRTVVAVILGASSLSARAEESAGLLHEALTKRVGSVTLDTLEPYGDDRGKVRDVSGEICSAAARKARSELRDAAGDLILRSPYLAERDREPNLVPAPTGPPIGDGPASATEAALLIGTRYIPLPSPRPAIEIGETR